MSIPSELSNSIPLGEWVETLLNKVFFQPDDTLAMEHFDQFISPDFRVRVNHDSMNKEQFKALVQKVRSGDTFTLKSNDELQLWLAKDGSGAGCVGIMSHFTSTNKETGEEAKSSTLISASVQIHEEHRVLAELIEILKPVDSI